MTIEQTVEIPPSHRITIDVPREVPAGATARFKLNVFPFEKKDENSELPLKSLEGAETPHADRLLGAAANFRLSKKELDEIVRNADTPVSDSLTGILAHLGDITIEQIREERLAEYLP